MRNHLVERVKSANTIQFVCSGNIIRSSFAELYARHLGLDNVASYGTTYQNSSIHDKSKRELEKIRIDQTYLEQFSPTHIDEISEFDPSDLHIVMTSKHRNQLINHGIAPDAIIKVTELIGRNDDVADPYFEGNYDQAYSTIKKAVSQINNILTGDL